LWDAWREVQGGGIQLKGWGGDTPESFPVPQEGEFGYQITAFCPGKDAASMGKWGFKPSSGDA